MYRNRVSNRPFKAPRMVGASVAPQTTNPSLPEKFERKLVAQDRVSQAGVGLPPMEKKSVECPQQSSHVASAAKRVFAMNFRKVSNKKHKSWDGDGFAVLKNEELRFYKDGKPFGRSVPLPPDMFGTVMRAGGLEVQLDYEVTNREEIDRLGFGSSQRASQDNASQNVKVTQDPQVRRVSALPPRKMARINAQFKPVIKQEAFVRPQNGKFLPLFDSSKINDPLVMHKTSHADVDVVVDPILSDKLRPHQREGVLFLYDCLLGLEKSGSEYRENDDIRGCLLADDMGLGKTLQAITIVWTLLKQNPYPSLKHGPIAQKVLIVCPVTLIGNWKREFRQWLGVQRVGVLVLRAKNTKEQDKVDVKNFFRSNACQVLILGYEKVLTLGEELMAGQFDLLICDEGHRLKNASSKCINLLASLEIPRRVLVTGTPIQNDLVEYFTLIDFINPGILGSFAQFKRDFIAPITLSRDVKNKHNTLVMEKGEERSRELIETTKRFTIRRTSEINSKYLPPRTDISLFCRPSVQQLQLFQKTLEQAPNLDTLTYSSSLALITKFKKICNSPKLVGEHGSSGKMNVLMQLLFQFHLCKEKVVVISNYTQTLDIIQDFLNNEGMKFVRLDGSTASKSRDLVVKQFNEDHTVFCFLLSAKSGGVGLNLIGGSRLVMFDNDWNPATDLQAMSRIHRDGQRKPCYIYRLFTTGCIDEKILQRQMMKSNLSEKFLAEGDNEDNLFEDSDLKDLFTVQDTVCNTHDLVCDCDGIGEDLEEVEEGDMTLEDIERSVEQSDIGNWNSAKQILSSFERIEAQEKETRAKRLKECLSGFKHINPLNTGEFLDQVTDRVATSNRDITFAFVKTTNALA